MMPIWSRLLLTALSVLLCLLSLPGGGLPILALVALVPLGLAIHGAPPLQAMGLAYGFGLAGWIAATGGLAAGLSSYVALSVWKAPVFMAGISAYLALPYGLFGYCYGASQWMARPRGSLKAAACLSAALTFFPSPLPVTPAHALYGFPPAIQLLALGGEPLLLFLLCLINWMLVALALRIKRDQPLIQGLAPPLALVSVILGYGFGRVDAYHHREASGEGLHPIRIVAIQPNIPLPTNAGIAALDTKVALSDLYDMSRQALNRYPGVDLLVWPEIPRDLDCASLDGIRERLSADSTAQQTAFLLNCVQPLAGAGKYNAALFVSPLGRPSAYFKRKLFPFAEYLPGEETLPVLRTLLPGASQYRHGTRSVVFPVNGDLSIMVAICYEILFADPLRSFPQRGGGALINQTDDAWFGTSRITDFLIAASTFRAVELGVPVVRVSNSGNTLMIRADGEIDGRSRSASFIRTVKAFDVLMPEDHRVPLPRLPVLACVVALAWAVEGWKLVRSKPWSN